MSPGNPLIDDVGECHNLSRVSKLTDEVITIANSSSWRRHRTACGDDEWRKCRFDFLPQYFERDL
ncbi:MAG TPA: hypothetical protein VF070_03515 [Streptosporangiaceae bacterium]